MKTIFLTLVFLAFTSCLFAQTTDTSKVEQYCELVATGRLLSKKVTIAIDYGETASIWKDQRIKDDEGKVAKFNSVVDALNYMARNGWVLFNAYPIGDGGVLTYHFYFKKLFNKSEVDAQ